MRLIDAEALIDEINEMWKIHPAGLENRKILSFEAVIDLIGAAPTIEAKPVVHAHFCWNCGVQMDESISCSHEDDNHIAEDGKKGVKIPVISMEDVPKIMEEMEK